MIASIKASINNKVLLIEKNDTLGKKLIITIGGLSYPNTWSTRDGYKFAKDLNHNRFLSYRNIHNNKRNLFSCGNYSR